MVDLSPADLEEFEHNGVIRVRAALHPDRLRELERSIDAHLYRWPILNRLVFGDPRFFTRPNVWKTDPWFFAFVQNEVLVCLASRLLRSTRINLLQDQIFVKLRGCDKVFDWHKDSSYAPIEGTKMVSMWMASQRVTPETGGLQFVRGSHRGAEAPARPRLLPIERLFPFLDSGRRAPRPKLAVREEEVISFVLEPGDIVAFHGALLHRSGPNASDDTERKGYSVRYVGDDATYRPGPDNGITYHFWDPGIRPGERLEGPLFPVLLDADQPIRREYPGPQRMQLRRIVLSQLRYLRNTFSRPG
jgi:ectoine hydroxylase-related dioxygenase (phytanoyl-CoA dioxygenase family)